MKKIGRMRGWILGLAGVLLVAVIGLGTGRTPSSDREPAAGNATGAQVVPGAVSESAAEPVAEHATLGDADGRLKLMGLVQEPDQAKLCDADRWPNMKPSILEIGSGEVFVDASDWEPMPVGTKVQVASWISKCIQNGHTVAIRGYRSRDALALYDVDQGYIPAP